MEKLHFDVYGMTCASCVAHVTKAVEKLDGTKNVNVNLLTNDMTLDVDTSKVNSDKIVRAIEDAGYGASLAEDNKKEDVIKKNKSTSMKNKVQISNEKAVENLKKRLIISLIFWIPLMYLAMYKMLPFSKYLDSIFGGEENALIYSFTQLLLLIPIIFTNRAFFINGFKSLFKLNPNMDSLVSIGATASLCYGIVAIYNIGYGLGHQNMELVSNFMSNLYFESAGTILTLITLGKFLEAKSKSKTGDAISKLINLAPKKTIVIRNGKEVEIPSEEIEYKDIILIKPGMSIPVDGTIISGATTIDESAITGESIPVEKEEKDKVISGTVNINGTFKMVAQAVGDETTLAKIVKLVEEASTSKAPIENLADKIAGVFVPVVITISLVTFIIWMIVSKDISLALNMAISVLVISCPCALGLATPVAIMVGTGKGAQFGVLIKNAQSLQKLDRVKYVVMDKTGTITKGKPFVTDIITDMNEKEFLEIVSSLEKNSEHPLAIAIMNKAKEMKIQPLDVTKFKATIGRGVEAVLDGNIYYGGNLKLMIEKKVKDNGYLVKANNLLNNGRTVLYFANEKEIVGIVGVSDVIKEDSVQAINMLKERGIKTVMTTGDNSLAANSIQKQVGLDEVYSEVLPQDKEKIVSRIKNSLKNGEKVAFVGDGINDSIALAASDVGIAIGSGTDIAIESADIILIKDSLIDVVNAIDLSHKTMKNIKENLFWAFFYNIICIPVAAGLLYSPFGLKLNPMLGSLAMSFSSVFVVTNALRLRFFKPIKVNNSIEDKEKMEVKEMKEVSVEGMMCQNCVKHVTKAIESVKGVNKVNVSLEDKKAYVEGNNISDDEIVQSVKDAGYEVTKIENK